jgi:nucleoside-diphosphate-sugar epimerase
MRIIVIGANGQVGAEVTLMLANAPGIDVRPIVRSRSGSAFLRYHGVPVMHGNISDPEQSKRLLEGGDIIANFALALGTPAASLKQNEQIVTQMFEGSPESSTIVFFSTLAVLGLDGISSGRSRTMYSKLKLRNERQVQVLARKSRRRAYVLRLGHVAGVYQNINQMWRAEIEAGPVRLVEPERRSNVTFTETIADALCAIGEGRAGPPGLYDLVNQPQWSWRGIYTHEAERLGVRLVILPPRSPNETDRAATATVSLKGMMLAMISRLGLREKALKLASELPDTLNESLKAEHYVSRARAEIAELSQLPPIRNSAQLWPAINGNHLTGLRETMSLLVDKVFVTDRGGAMRWPADL